MTQETKKRTRRGRQGVASSCSKCGARIEFSSWMALNRFLNSGRVCESCKSRALAEDTFRRIEGSVAARDAHARKFA